MLGPAYSQGWMGMTALLTAGYVQAMMHEVKVPNSRVTIVSC